jgi:hypothetical protein
MDNEKPRPTVNIELGEKESEGIYSNLALITHSPSEVVIDFARHLPGAPKSRVYARIIMTPFHAKALLLALEENLGKFEAKYGKVRMNGLEGERKDIGF